jgi:hypothetical protein
MNATEEGRPRRRLAAAGMLAVGLLAGGILAGSQLANAASSSGSSSSSSSSSSGSVTTHAPPAGVNPAKMTHGPGETLLTGSTASKVRAAALKAVPGATVIRVETDSGDATYEAHLQKADGSYVTVKFDKQLNVTGTEDGFGAGGPGMPGGPPPGSGSSNGTN